MPNFRKQQKVVPYSEEEWEAVKWCLENGIKISPLHVGIGSSSYYVDIDNNGNRNHSSDTYNEYDAMRKVYEYYLWYYKKYGLKL